MGYVFQRPSDNLIPYLTASEHIETAARIRGVEDQAGEHELLEALGIGGRRGHLPHQLSGGEQQRLAFASAIVGTPDLVIADEPTAELDSRSAQALLEIVAALARERFIAFAVATHDPDLVTVADRTLHLRHGAMEAETRAARALSVIDEAGRIQLPPKVLHLFPDRRAVISEQDGQVRITPP